MARRRFSSSIALPWERSGSRWRELFSGRRWRLATIVVGVLFASNIAFASIRERAKARETRVVIAEVRRAIWKFREEMGRCPYTVRELVQPGRGRHRYLEEEPTDGWGNPLWIRCPGRYDPNGVDVVSAGPSGNFLVDDHIQ